MPAPHHSGLFVLIFVLAENDFNEMDTGDAAEQVLKTCSHSEHIIFCCLGISYMTFISLLFAGITV